MMFFGPIFKVLAAPVFVRLVLILALVEAVFLAESFTTLMEQALRFGGSSTDVLWLLLLKAPHILDLGLALGMMVAVYFAVTDARNSGELIVLATSGVWWGRITLFSLVIGLTGSMVSIGIGGYLQPLAAFAERVTLSELRAEYLTTQIMKTGPRSARETLDGVTFIATPPEANETGRGKLFFFQQETPQSWRAGLSKDWDIVGAESSSLTGSEGPYKITLKSFKAYQGATGPNLFDPKPINVFDVRNASMAFDLNDLVPPTDRTPTRAERVLILNAKEAPRVSEIAARALLVPFASLLALAALLVGGRGIGRFIALPLALLLVMVIDVAGRSILSEFASSGSVALLAICAITIYLAPPLMYIFWRGEAIMTPSKGDT